MIFTRVNKPITFHKAPFDPRQYVILLAQGHTAIKMHLGSLCTSPGILSRQYTDRGIYAETHSKKHGWVK